MSDEHQSVEEEIEDVLLDDADIDISHISYDDKDLLEWEDSLTVILPSLPCTAQEITQCLIDISNKYQIAYNAYTRLMVIAGKAENAFKAEKYRLCAEYSADAKTKGVKTLPAMDKIEMIVINADKNVRLRAMLERHQIYDKIKEFFGNNKTKLEKVMQLAKDISFSVNASDRIYQNAQYHSGIKA